MRTLATLANQPQKLNLSITNNTETDAPGLGHSTSGSSQGNVSVWFPWQLIATPGIRWQVLVRCLVPPEPHVTEHGVADDQQDHSPIHGCWLHGRVSWAGPAQSSPAPCAAGAVHVRCLQEVPPAQDALHTDQLDHDDHWPSTSATPLDTPALQSTTSYAYIE